MGLLFGSAGAHTYLKSGQVAPTSDCDKFLARKFIVSLEHLPFTILAFYLLDVLCSIQENITVYKVSSKNFDLDFDRPKCNWINQVLGF